MCEKLEMIGAEMKLRMVEKKYAVESPASVGVNSQAVGMDSWAAIGSKIDFKGDPICESAAWYDI